MWANVQRVSRLFINNNIPFMLSPFSYVTAELSIPADVSLNKIIVYIVAHLGFIKLIIDTL